MDRPLSFAGVQLSASPAPTGTGNKFSGRIGGFKITVWPTSVGWRANCVLGRCSVSATGANETASAALSELRSELRRTAKAILGLLERKARRV